jgi:RNA polymerase sigma-70 factor (ECF subfamily)
VTEEDARALISSVCDGWYNAILRYAWRLCGSMEMAEDLVQDALLQLYAELRRGRFIGNPRAWVVIVVRRQAAKQSAARRQQVKHTVSVDTLENLAGLTTATESPYPEGDALTELLRVLTKREEEVIFLRMAAMKYREIGDQLGISASAVNTLLARALRKLRAASGADRNENSKHENVAIHPKTLQ